MNGSDGNPISERAIYRRLPARNIQNLVFARRRLNKTALVLEQQEAALLKKLTGGAAK
jgi:hypothetical protein